MKHGEGMLICALAGLVLCTPANGAKADSARNPYQGIIDRNVFRLNPRPPPGPEANKPPPPKMFLTGITTILGTKRALMKLTLPAKPGEQAKEQFFTLGEGERDGEVEVLEIDEKARTVKVSYYGTITTLDFDNNGVKAAAAPGAGATPSAPGSVPSPTAHPYTPAGGTSPLAPPMRPPAPGGAATSRSFGGGTPPASASDAPVYASGTPAFAGGVTLLAFGATTPAVGRHATTTL